jgi:hypothetical protein
MSKEKLLSELSVRIGGNALVSGKRLSSVGNQRGRLDDDDDVLLALAVVPAVSTSETGTTPVLWRRDTLWSLDRDGCTVMVVCLRVLQLT